MLSPNLSNMPYSQVEKAYAKIILTLNIINKRKDNYHNLNSDLIFANIYDTISITLKTQKIIK